MGQVRNVTLEGLMSFSGKSEDLTVLSLQYNLCLSYASLPHADTCCDSVYLPIPFRLLGWAKIVCFVQSHFMAMKP